MPTKPHPKLLSWATDLDDKTLDQARRSSELPFIVDHVALMPDAHFGYGATVGSVIPTAGAIIPSAVGVDIGCLDADTEFLSPDGWVKMSDWAGHAVLTYEPDFDTVTFAQPRQWIDLPCDVFYHFHNSKGMNQMVSEEHRMLVFSGYRARGYASSVMNPGLLTSRDLSRGYYSTKASFHSAMPDLPVPDEMIRLDVMVQADGRVWLMLHSGSRGVGNELANFHIDGAKDLMKRYFIDLEDPDLAYLTEGTTEFGEYIDDMLWAQDYALGNRSAMMNALVSCVETFLGRELWADFSVNCHHNYTAREHHHGRNVWVTRKGAIRARDGDWGVIPGSMGTKSYIVEGLGNPASFQSCSHGAGRRMSRNQARKTLDHAGLEAAMEGKAWNHDASSLIDEDPRAYKDVGEVMAAQADLVEVRYELTQILNMKGT